MWTPCCAREVSLNRESGSLRGHCGWWVDGEGEAVMGAGSPVRRLLPEPEGKEAGVGVEVWAQIRENHAPSPPPSARLTGYMRCGREESGHTPGLLTWGAAKQAVQSIRIGPWERTWVGAVVGQRE